MIVLGGVAKTETAKVPTAAKALKEMFEADLAEGRTRLHRDADHPDRFANVTFMGCGRM